VLNPLLNVLHVLLGCIVKALETLLQLENVKQVITALEMQVILINSKLLQDILLLLDLV